MIINGKNIYISVRDDTGTYYPIACDMSCTIRMERPVMVVSRPGDSVWRRVIPGSEITGTVSGNGLINFNKHTSLFELGMKLQAGTEVLMLTEIQDTKAGGSFVAEMSGYVTAVELTGAYRAAGSFVYEIAVDGRIAWSSTIPKDENETGMQNFLLIGDGTDTVLGLGDGSNLII